MNYLILFIIKIIFIFTIVNTFTIIKINDENRIPLCCKDNNISSIPCNNCSGNFNLSFHIFNTDVGFSETPPILLFNTTIIICNLYYNDFTYIFATFQLTNNSVENIMCDTSTFTYNNFLYCGTQLSCVTPLILCTSNSCNDSTNITISQVNQVQNIININCN